jgi:Rod binding domain-containing protein
MDIPPLQTGTLKASDVPINQLAGNAHLTDKQKVKEACRQFEAILVRQIMTEVRKPVIGSEESNENGIYSDMINSQMADCISRSGSFGLAKSLENQLVHQVLPKSGDGLAAKPAVNSTDH